MMHTKKLFMILSLAAILSFVACNRETQSSAEITGQDSIEKWLPQAVLYEVNLRHHTPEGNIPSFIKELDKLDELGVNVLWIMPVQPIGIKNRKAKGDLFVADIKDSTERKKYRGSPYAIKDYMAINPDYGTLEDFKKLVDACHAKGMKIILDWVGNHTAWDNQLITDHPDWYTKNTKGEITDPLNEKGESIGWTDVADLNYDNKDLWKYMANAMKFWVDSCDIDGFRCDVAMNVPAAFWNFAKEQIELSKPVFMLAESEEHEMNLYDSAFNAYYGWEVHHVLNEISKGNMTTLYLDTVLQKKYAKFSPNVYAMNFITNHDENSWNGTEFERMGDAWKAMAVFTFTSPGLPLLYTGQEYGLKKRLRFFEKDTVIASDDFKYFDFYKTLVSIHKNNKSLWNVPENNKLHFIPTVESGLVMYKRENGDNSLLVIINMTNTPIKINPALPSNVKYLYRDGLDQKAGVLSAWGSAILKL